MTRLVTLSATLRRAQPQTKHVNTAIKIPALTGANT
jgi:hypothetical protein